MFGNVEGFFYAYIIYTETDFYGLMISIGRKIIFGRLIFYHLFLHSDAARPDRLATARKPPPQVKSNVVETDGSCGTLWCMGSALSSHCQHEKWP